MFCHLPEQFLSINISWHNIIQHLSYNIREGHSLSMLLLEVVSCNVPSQGLVSLKRATRASINHCNLYMC